jgi:hypothetical protein
LRSATKTTQLQYILFYNGWCEHMILPVSQSDNV